MYSHGELGTIVGHYRKPRRPSPLCSIDDLKKRDNAVLLSDYVAGRTRKEVAEALKDLRQLEKKLTPLLRVEEELPITPSYDGVSYEEPLTFLAASIRMRTEKFAEGFDDTLLVADRVPQVYRFPSGFEVPYFSLINEQSANLSIFLAGFGEIDPDVVYVRENFVTMMLALSDVLQDHPSFFPWEDEMKDFEKYIRGIVIAHELSEIQHERQGMPYTTLQDRELASEKGTRRFLKKHEVRREYYELFHKLRAGEEEGNISRMVLDQTPQPFC